MNLYIDNDALLKLAHYDLFDGVLKIFNAHPEDVYVLATARYVLLPSNQRLRHCIVEECATRLEEVLSRGRIINADRVNGDVLDELSGIPNIDAGEAIIFATAASDRDSYILTGDKRALIALSNGNGCGIVRNALAGRVFTMEQLLLLLVNEDFTRVQSNVRENSGVDRAMTIAFGVSAPANYKTVCDALNSYIGDLRTQTGILLHAS